MSNETKTTAVEQEEQKVVETTAEPVTEKQVDPPVTTMDTEPVKKNWMVRGLGWIGKKVNGVKEKLDTPTGNKVATAVAVVTLGVVAAGGYVAIKALKTAAEESEMTNDSYIPASCTPVAETVADVVEATSETVGNVVETVAENVGETVSDVISGDSVSYVG